jgi:EmrB/QacA subfamily drug resistance transporter
MTADARPSAIADATATPGAANDRFAWGTMLIVVSGMFMVTLDFFIVNVAIPSTQAQLHAGPAGVQFIVAGFGVAYASGMITGGRLGDLYGRRRLFAIGMGLFTVASLGCGLAPSTAVLITGRVLQGVGAALLSPQVLAILNVTFTGKHRAMAFNGFALSIGVAGTFGQLIGGLLIKWNPDGLGWRTIFLINVPIGIVVLSMLRAKVAESRGTGRSGLDLVGTLLVTCGLVAIVLPLVLGREQGWPVWEWVLSLGLAVVLLASFAFYQGRLERIGKAPLVSLSLFRERAFSVGVGITLVYFSAMASFFLILALYLQEGHGLSPLRSGLTFVSMGFGFFAGSPVGMNLAAKIGKQVLAAGALLVGVGFVVVFVTVSSIGVTGSLLWLVVGLLVAGLGMGLVMAPLTPTVLAGVAPSHAAAAAGVLSTAQESGNALGVAIVGAVFFNALATGAQSGFAGALNAGIEVLIGFMVAVAILVQLLPKSASIAPAEPDPATVGG